MADTAQEGVNNAMSLLTPIIEARECPEMLSTISDPNLEVHQITTDLDSDAHVAAMHLSHALFTPDSTRCVFVRQRGAGLTDADPARGSTHPLGKVELALCEIDEGFALRTLTDEEHVGAPVMTPDGRYLYYFLDQSGEERPRIILKRIDLHDFRTETVLVVDSPVEGVGRVPRGGHMYDAASLSRDGTRLSTSCSFYQDDDPLFSDLIIDLERMSIRGFLFQPYDWRPLGTYYRGRDPRYFHHLLFVHGHRRSGWDAQGQWYNEPDGLAERATLHVRTDEGLPVGSVPIGDEGEGVDHPVWRGGLYEVVTHTSSFTTAPYWRGIMLMAAPVACAPEDQYKGARIPGARRTELTRFIKRPDLCHHAWDAAGTRVVCDTEGWHGRGPTAYLWLGTVVDDDAGAPYVLPKYLLHPQSSWNGSYWLECQPAMSPDCRTIFFNSDYLCKPGHPQVFCVRGFTFPEL